MEMPKGVRLMELTPDKVKELWDKLHVIDGLFDDMTKGNFQLFVSRLQAPDSVWLEREDGNGILYLTSVIPGLSAFGHVVYWDKRLRGREDFTLECLHWLMDMLRLRKVNVWLPDYSKAAHAFIKRLGFTQEGKLRAWSFSGGKLFDMHTFGIMYEEVINGRLHETGDGHISRSTPEHGNGLVSEPTETGRSTDGRTGDSDLRSGSQPDAEHDREIRTGA